MYHIRNELKTIELKHTKVSSNLCCGSVHCSPHLTQLCEHGAPHQQGQRAVLLGAQLGAQHARHEESREQELGLAQDLVAGGRQVTEEEEEEEDCNDGGDGDWP